MKRLFTANQLAVSKLDQKEKEISSKPQTSNNKVVKIVKGSVFAQVQKAKATKRSYNMLLQYVTRKKTCDNEMLHLCRSQVKNLERAQDELDQPFQHQYPLVFPPESTAFIFLFFQKLNSYMN